MPRFPRVLASAAITLALTASLLLPTAVTAAPSSTPARVMVNGSLLNFDVPPTAEAGRTLVPIRAIFEALGAEVGYEAETRTAVAVKDDLTVRLQVDNPIGNVNGQPRQMDVPARGINGRILAPLRFVGETLGAKVGWYGGARLITINTPPAALVQKARVARVVDGDTIELEGGEKVRLIGIDTPETVKPDTPVQPFGPEASAFTKQLLPEGQEIDLELDAEERDRYGRLLGYVYLPDGTMVNAAIMDAGLAQVMTIPPNVKYADLFLTLQQDARSDGRGLWAGEQPPLSGQEPGVPLQVVASVNNPRPAKYSSVTVTVKVTDFEGRPVQGAAVTLVAHYKTKDSTFDAGMTGPDGIASKSFSIGGATSGFEVWVDVTVTHDGKSATVRTSFTSQ